MAGGFGERLRPLSLKIPKPLLPICGVPVIERVLQKIEDELSPEGIGINLHYRAEDIKKRLAKHPLTSKISFFFEDPILGTGGALKNAEEFLKESIFLVHNSDIICDLDLKRFLEFHLSKGYLATLAIHDYSEFNNLIVDGDRLIGLKRGSPSGGKKAFTGIAVYEPEFLRFIPPGYFSIVDAWIKAIDEGYPIGVYDITGSFWADIGTPESYARTVFSFLRRDGENVYVHPSMSTDDLEIKGFASIEAKVRVRKGSTLRNAIILGGNIEGNIENMILCEEVCIPLNEGRLFEVSGEGILIGTGGSDRAYYRVGKGLVLMKCKADDPDFLRHIEYTSFLLSQGVKVARLIEYNEETKCAIFEDLGDITLYSYLKGKKDLNLIESIYNKVIDLLVKIHGIELGSLKPLNLRIFDYEHFRWESRYFVERFLKPFLGVEPWPELEEFFETLAKAANIYAKTLIHRDFQSQNIMIRDGTPYVIDFQGMRLGPPGYDVVSLLWDPYFRLEDSLRDRLLVYYVEKAKRMISYFEKMDFFNSLPVMRLQRHLQTLGAYGYLSVVKGKKYFSKHIPEALRLLKEDILLVNELNLFKEFNSSLKRLLKNLSEKPLFLPWKG